MGLIRQSLVRKIVIGYVALVLIPTLFVGILFFITNRNQLIEDQNKALSRNIQQSCVNAYKNLDRIAELNIYLQQNNNFLRFLDGDYARPVDQLVEYVLEFDTIFNYMRATKDVESIRIFVKNTSVLRFGQVMHHISEMEEVSGGSETKGFWRYDEEKGKMIYRKAITDASILRTLAILEVECLPDIVLSSLNIFEKDDQYQLQLVMGDACYEIKEGALFPAEEMKSTSTSNRIENLSADVLVNMEYDQYYAGKDREILFYLMLLVLPLLIMTGIYFSIALNISRRIAALAKHIEYSGMSTPMPNDIPKGDDIDELIDVYNEMLKRNDLLTGQVKLEQLQKQQASFLALQAQMHPHFIYNALEDIRMMAELQDATQLSDMIYTLSRFIRYALTSKTRFVSLEDELGYTSQYLKIEKMRLGDRLTYEITMDSRLSAVYCPKFIIQPLVENAIVHGLSSQPSGGFLRVQITPYDNGAAVEITDDGAGLSEEKIERINELLSRGEDLDGIATGNGIGLSNVNTRMRQLYGANFSLLLLKNPTRNGMIAKMRWKGEIQNETIDCG